jgi:amino acid adenylation domain-containing protein
MDDLSNRIAALSPEQRALLELRLKQKQENQSQTSTIAETSMPNPSMPSMARDGDQPVSFAQQRMWFQEHLGHNSATSNNIAINLHINGALQVAALEQSIRAIIQRHDILRTTLKMSEGNQLIQVIVPVVTFTLPLIDLRALPKPERDKESQRLAIEEARTSFDLERDQLLRIRLLQLQNDEYLMLMTVHHVVMDAWSLGIFFHELSVLYQAFIECKPSPLATLPLQYADFAIWQNQFLQSDALNRELSYWKQQLQGAPMVLQLPTDRPRPPVHSFIGKTQSFVVSRALTGQLKALSHQIDVTLFTTLLAAFNILLYRYTGQDDILVGSPIANRYHAEFENLIGCFINTLVLRTNLSGNPTVRDVLARTQEMVMDAFSHQNVPFEKLVNELQPVRNLSHPPLFQVMIVLQNAFSVETIQLSGLTVRHSLVDTGTAQFDLTLHLVEEAAGLVGRLEYNTDLFEDDTIARLIGHFQILLTGIVNHPEQRLSELPLLTPAEQQQLWEWNQTQVACPQVCIQHLFETRARETPDAPAVEFENEQITYQELNHRANQLAHYLRRMGIKPEVMVGICVKRSISMIVGILGILKAGGAYVPLDPSYPKDRLALILSDSQMPVLLTQNHLLDILPEHIASVVCLDTDWKFIAQESQENPLIQLTPKNLAYVIYTSGSTGQPKGVMVEHQPLVNYITIAINEYGLSSSDRILQFASISFDTAAEEIFPCLVSGATLVLRTEEMISSIPLFLERCHNWQLTVLDLPTAFWHHWVANLATMELPLPDSVRLVIIGGEKARTERLATWQRLISSSVRSVNTYGPTETTIVATTFDLTEFPVAEMLGRELPIGNAIANVKTYILDSFRQRVPVGIPGELYIGGIGVSRGYLNRPDLTSTTFIPDPFSDTPGARLYKTGDHVRYRPDGAIEFLGRIDRQVKIRGFRIEPGEIEALLTQHQDVQESIVIEREDEPGDKRLVAYIVSESNRLPNPSELRHFVEQKLPKYMMPTAFVILESLPLNPNGKVDRSVLPAPETRSELQTSLVTPRTPTEETLVTLFSQILNLSHVGIYDDFFELGGHSLLATQLITRILKQFQIKLTVVDLFEASNVAALAERIERMKVLEQMSGASEQLGEREEIEI